MQHSQYPAPPLAYIILLAGVLLLLGALSGCQGYSTPWPGAIYEDEPNGMSCCPDNMGTLYVGQSMHIRGSLDDCCIDVYDGFAFVPADLCTVQFTLDADSPYADLDLGLYDPWTGTFTAIFDSPLNPEFGSFLVLEPGRPFHLVASSYSGDSGYSLRLDCLPFNYGPGASSDGSSPTSQLPMAGPDSSGQASRDGKLTADQWADYAPSAAQQDSEPLDKDEQVLPASLWLVDPLRSVAIDLARPRHMSP